MKKSIFFILIIFWFASSYAQYMPAERHFKIYARVSDNKFFYDLQKELNINPIVASYIIYVNTYFQADEYLRKEEDNIELDLGNNSKVTFNLYSLSENTRNKLFDNKNASEYLESNDQTLWSFFRINANVKEDSLFMWVQNDFNVNSYMEKYEINVDLRSLNPEEQTIYIFDNKNKYKKLWSEMNTIVQYGLIHWTGSNKLNLNKKQITFSTPFSNNVSEIKSNNLRFNKPETNFSKLLKSSFSSYRNNYFQFFGGERTGIPIKENIGLLLGTGTKYSGPGECNEVSVGLSFFGISASYLSRVLFLQYNFGSYFINEGYNKLNVKPAVEIKADIPFGDYLSLSYLKVIDENIPIWQNYFFTKDSSEIKYMPSNLISKDYFNFELKYPFTFFNSEKAQLYLAYYLKEINLGFYSRESRIASGVFDFRTNFTFTQMRNFQILIEILFSGFSQSFGMNSIAIGPSFRFSKLVDYKFGLHTLMLNVRLKLGAEL